MKIDLGRIPSSVQRVCRNLHDRGYEAWIVGGAVRDLASRKNPKDWDIATNARPSEIESTFKKTIPTGKEFGTITVLLSKNFKFEVTTYRREGSYRDGRRPSSIRFLGKIDEDLGRRDFTVNAMALSWKTGKVLDPFGGLGDLRRKRIRAVGKAEERFTEDGLRIFRAGRFSSQLDFGISKEIEEAAKGLRKKLKGIAVERINQEFSKLLLGRKPSRGIEFFRKTGLLEDFFPEILEGRGVMQGGWHDYDVYRHTLKVLDLAEPILEVRLGALLHDIAKPRCRVRDGKRIRFTGHEKMGQEMTEKFLKRLRYSNEIQKSVLPLIRHHLFAEDDALASKAATRRFIRRVGEENLRSLFLLRRADIRGCGLRKKIPKALGRLEKEIQGELRGSKPLSLENLAINGRDIMRILNCPPSPEIGRILENLLGHVLNAPEDNKKRILEGLARIEGERFRK